MKRFMACILAVALLIAVGSPSFASVGIKKDGKLDHTATDINFKSMGAAITNDGSTTTFALMLAGIGSGGATSMATSTTAVPLTFAFVNMAISSDVAFIGKTLADGVPGQQLTLNVYQQQSTNVLTITPATASTFTNIQFNEEEDNVTLLFIDGTTGWIILNKNSVVVLY